MDLNISFVRGQFAYMSKLRLPEFLMDKEEWSSGDADFVRGFAHAFYNDVAMSDITGVAV